MQEVRNWSDLVVASANEFWQAVGAFLPKLLGAVVLIVVGALLAKAAASLTERALTLFGANKVRKNKTVSQALKQTGLDVDYVSIVGRIVFWVVIIIFAMTAADVLELTAMTDVIRELLAYLPNVLAAAIIVTITIAGGRLVRDLVAAALVRMSLDYSVIVGTVAQWAIVVFGTVMALGQLGFDTTVLTANVTVLVAGVTLAFALAFGLGGRDAAADVVNDVRKRLKSRK